MHSEGLQEWKLKGQNKKLYLQLRQASIIKSGPYNYKISTMKLLQLEKGMKPTLFFYHNLMGRPGRSGSSMVLQKIESIYTLFLIFVWEQKSLQKFRWFFGKKLSFRQNSFIMAILVCCIFALVNRLDNTCGVS